MEANMEDLQSDQDLWAELAQKFSDQLIFCKHEEIEETKVGDDGEEEEENNDCDEENDDVDFSFFCDGSLLSPIAAEDVFYNGEIRPVFPLFNRDLLLDAAAGGGADVEDLKEGFPVSPTVKNVFVETGDRSTVTSSSPGNQEIAGPYCAWSKKSNSTGFSKLWRFKDFLHRSNSDGRDAFVFLNPRPAPSKTPPASGDKTENKESGEVKVKVPQKKIKKSEAILAHERYMRSKAKDNGGKRQSYLPYRPELVGLFTNVNGGLTRNVHPF